MRLSQIAGRAVVPLPEGGALFFGLGRDASYEAAERGEIPCITVGRRKVMPVYAALHIHGMPDELIARVLLGTTPPNSQVTGPSEDPATCSEIGPAKDDHDNDSAPDRSAKSNGRHLTPVARP